MKKVLLSAAVLGGMLFGANAQDEAAASGGYKQEAGNKTIEVKFNPGSIFATGGDQFTLFDGLKLRSFSSETSALRLGVDLTLNSETEITTQESDTQKELKTKTSDFSLMLKPGMEKHFAGTDRLSPYVGAQALIGLSSESTNVESGGASDADIETLKTKNGDATKKTGLTFGLGAFAGVDYYFAKKLYIGAEVGYGFKYTGNAKTVVENSALDGDAAKVESKNGSSIALSPELATGNIRIGWTF